jgi:hypothetical protein
MKKLSIGSYALAVILSVVSILLTYGASNAGELLDTSSAFRQTSGIDTSPAMFFALNKINTLEKQADVMPMTDAQLAFIEGEAGPSLALNLAISTVVQNATAVVVQNAIAVLSDANLNNRANVTQIISNALNSD